MKSFLLVLFTFCCLAFKGFGQSITVYTHSYYGLWNNAETEYFYSGGGFQISYQHPIKKGALLGGINFRTINWGNQVGATFGYSTPYVRKEKWSLSGVTSADLGLALFVNNPLLVYAVDYTPIFTWHRNKRFDFEAGIGIRFTHCPAYGNYGKINQVLDLPLKLGVKYRLDY